MLREKNLPNKFWAEAAHTTVFLFFILLQNRLPTRTVKDHTSYKDWYGYKPSLIFSKYLNVCISLMFHRASVTSLIKEHHRAFL